MADAIVTPTLIDKTYKALQESSQHDLRLEWAFSESQLAQDICAELSAFESEQTCVAILTLCKMAFVLGWTTAHIARQNALAGGVQ
jgi:hypothetical protein